MIFFYYESRETPFNLDFLNDKMKESGASERDLPFEEIIELLKERFRNIDYDSEREDAMTFMVKRGIGSLEQWDPELFIRFTEDLCCQGEIKL